MRVELDAAVQGGKDLRVKLDEIKERLAFALAQNQRMSGYLERVQEDDVVREELVTTGSPEGEQRLVPKRKPTIFAPQMYHAVSHNLAHGEVSFACSGREKNPPRHWVTY